MVIHSNIIHQGKLVSFIDWCNYIDSLKKHVKLEKNEEKAVNLIQEPFIKAIKKRLPNKKFGIFFSGGVDSTTIAFMCKKLELDFICYTVGIKGSQDLEWSIRIAKDLKLNHVKKELTLEVLEQLFEETAKVIKNSLNVVNLGVGAVELAALKLANKDKINTFFGGLGSEEIFAGYKRHEDAKNINEECWTGLKTTYERDFKRDVAIANYAKVNFLTPFLDSDLIIAAMSIDGKLKIKNGYKKYIFRKLSQKLGLKKEYAFRPKRAAQYGSNFDKAILKLAKQKGFKYKSEYLASLDE